MNAKLAGLVAVGVLVVAIAIVAVDGLIDHRSAPAPTPGVTASSEAPAGKTSAPKPAESSSADKPRADVAPAERDAATKPEPAAKAADRPASASAGKTKDSVSGATKPENRTRAAKPQTPEEPKAATIEPLLKAPEKADQTSGKPAKGQTAGRLEKIDIGKVADLPGTPTFDILRVEPDGSAVIAGHAAPHARIDVMNGTEKVTSTEADKTGDFATVLATPLAPGAYALRLKATNEKDDTTRLSSEVATVSIPKNTDDGVLAMVTKPGEASRIIATPKPQTGTGAATDTTMPAAAVPQSRKAIGNHLPVVGTQKSESNDAGSADSQTIPDRPAANDSGDTDIADAATSSSGSPPATTGVSIGSRASRPPMTASDDEGSASTSTGDSAPKQTDLAMLPHARQPAVRSTPSSGADAPGQASPSTGGAPASGRSKVHVDAVEVENDDVYVAGAAPPGATVRVYADDAPVGQDRATREGRFVAHGSMDLPAGRHSVRADVIDSGSGKVQMRATVPFDRPDGKRFSAVSPQTAELAGEAGAGAASDNRKLPVAAHVDPLEEKAHEAVSRLKGQIAQPSPDPARINAARAMAETSLRALAGPPRFDRKSGPADHNVDEKAANSARHALAAIRSLPELAPQEPLEPSQLDAMRTKMTGVLQTMKAIPPGPPPDLMAHAGDGRGASESGPESVVQPALTTADGFVIIRHGDTLWQISDRVYGRGVRYTTIYFANTDEITDPDLILPGQVFDVPKTPLKDALKLHHELLRKEKRR